MEPLSSIPSTIFSFIFFFYALLRVLSRRLITSQRQKLPPDAGGAWPLIGHLYLLSGPEPAHKTLADMAYVYGPIFTMKLEMLRAVIVSNWEIAKNCFTTNDQTFASRPKLAAAKHMGYDNSMFAFTQYGPFWRHTRKLNVLELLTSHRLEQFRHIRTSKVQSSIKKLYEECHRGEEKVLVEMKTWFKETTLNIILRIVVGNDYSTRRRLWMMKSIGKR